VTPIDYALLDRLDRLVAPGPWDTSVMGDVYTEDNRKLCDTHDELDIPYGEFARVDAYAHAEWIAATREAVPALLAMVRDMVDLLTEDVLPRIARYEDIAQTDEYGRSEPNSAMQAANMLRAWLAHLPAELTRPLEPSA
jgi:hypothetical protein